MKLINIVGLRFGKWTVLERHPENYRSTFARWVCKCDCGAERIVLGNSLRRGKSTGCGCKQYSDLSKRLTKHGHAETQAETPEYRSWKSMKGRCLNPNNQNYADYAGRGITIDPKWIDSFEKFYSDMGPRPKGTSLDRIDNDKGYSAENCRWASQYQQVHNRRCSRAARKLLPPAAQAA